MKKFYMIAAVALVASAACTKVETVETSVPDPTISFQVANYVGQTKAETSLVDEGFTSFRTYAWYTSTTATNQQFMNYATVEWNSSAKEWAPTDRTYYWPKTGYVNFFSFAGNHLPNSVALNGTSAEAHYTSAITVATNDNILIADGAYGFYNNDGAIYKKDGVTKGVPTLFRHMLSRVKFDIKVDGTGSSDNKDHWKVTVNTATLSYRNQGTLEVAFPNTPSITLGTDGKPSSGANQTAKYTTATWAPASVANVALNKVSSAVVVETDGGSASAAEELIADSVVMPQDLATTAVTVALNYTIEYSYNSGTANTETVPVAATALTTFTPTISAWAPNTFYTYHIIIVPTENKILFDPAVEAWAEVDTPTLEIK